ncbi:MAG TPA: LytTR family DNA-binding domain-containing protein [Draconibacterium sp.]|nr:LytTR family DNA-binding domain-containing protein [Draconibacterium sp.]
MNLQSIKTVIVDDEKPSREVLANYLREFCPTIQIIAECKSAKMAFKAISENQPQLVFLDIEMPKGSGFDLLRMFETINFKVIFVTAFSVYAVQAFRFSAVDFLLKPIKISELKEAVNKVQHEFEVKDAFLNVKTLLENLSAQSSPNRNLVIPDSKGFSVIKTSDIIYCEAEGYCTRFFLFGKIKISSSRNLKFYEDILPQNLFIRTHHSYIVNLQHVKGYSNQEEILLTDGLKCPLSAGNKHQFIGLFKKH